MADVKWSTLFPKTGGSGRGGAFTGKVLTPAMSPYTVTAGDRLVVTQTDQPLVIDPSGLKDDETFQVIDASRNFDKNPVTIKGDKLAIQIVGAGNDLILDMIGAGNLWEFIANSGQLLVADSPGYTGDLPAGGGGSTPTTPADPNAARWFYKDKDATHDDEAVEIGSEDVPYPTFWVNQTTGAVFFWPPNTRAYSPTTPEDIKLTHWKKVGSDGSLTVDPAIDANSTNPIQNKAVADMFGAQGKLISGFENEIKGLSGGGGIASVGVGQNTPTTNALPGMLYDFNFPEGSEGIPDVQVTLPAPKAGDKPIRILFNGGLSDAPPVSDAETNDVFGRFSEIAVTSPVPIVGAWDDFNSGDTSMNLDAPGELVEFSPLIDGDKVNWFISNANYITEDTHIVVMGKSDYTAKMGQTLICKGDVLITLPMIDAKSGLAPITIIFDYNANMGAQAQNGETPGVGIMPPVAPNGAFDFMIGRLKDGTNVPYDGKIPALLLNDREWVQLTPIDADTGGRFWLITGGTPSLNTAIRDRV